MNGDGECGHGLGNCFNRFRACLLRHSVESRRVAGGANRAGGSDFLGDDTRFRSSCSTVDPRMIAGWLLRLLAQLCQLRQSLRQELIFFAVTNPAVAPEINMILVAH